MKKLLLILVIPVLALLLLGQNATTGRLYASAPIRVGGGTATFATTAIASGACSATVTVPVTGALATDSISLSYATAPTAATDARLTINAWMTAGNANFCRNNPTAASITPTAIVLNFVVIR